MDAPGAAGSLDEPSASGELPRGQQAGVYVGMFVATVCALIPAAVLAWAALTVGASALAGTALLHTGGLEPRTFGPAMLVGLSIAAVLLIRAALAVQGEQSVAEVSPTGKVRTRAARPAGHPVLATMGVLLAASALTTLAGSAHSRFFPYPIATASVVATVAFFAVVALVACYRVLSGVRAATLDWAARAPYRAGVVTALLLLLGGAGVWAHYTGWSARPVLWAWHEAELREVRGPDDLVEAGEQLLCLGAGEVEPRMARSAAAPACEFLPGRVQVSASAPLPSGRRHGPRSPLDVCIETLMPVAYDQTVDKLAKRFPRETARDAASQAMLDTCRNDSEKSNLAGYFYRAAERRAYRSDGKARREVPCDELDTLEGTCATALSAVASAQMERIVKCLLTPAERVILELRRAGMTYREIGEELRLVPTQAKDTLNNAIKRLRRLKDLPLANCHD